ncbi:MAG TPA: hypothetical protein VHA56_11115 [Mucilaginibacter sp.]|nr:hypothetical protein [Mucilaginibacter sp.]
MYQENILKKAAFLRGGFINRSAIIEKLMEWYISYHFCQDLVRSYEMIDFLLGDRFVSFESKRSAFELLLKTHKKSEWQKSKDILSKLTSIQTERNRLAHLTVLVDNEAVDKFKHDGSIAFVKFKEKTEPLWYSVDRMVEIMSDADDIINWLTELNKL